MKNTSLLTPHAPTSKTEVPQSGPGSGIHRRGFASLSPERRREISSSGGKTAHALGVAHKWTAEEAKIAGRKGGAISRKRGSNRARTSVSYRETRETRV